MRKKSLSYVMVSAAKNLTVHLLDPAHERFFAALTMTVPICVQ